MAVLERREAQAATKIQTAARGRQARARVAALTKAQWQHRFGNTDGFLQALFLNDESVICS